MPHEVGSAGIDIVVKLAVGHKGTTQIPDVDQGVMPVGGCEVGTLFGPLIRAIGNVTRRAPTHVLNGLGTAHLKCRLLSAISLQVPHLDVLVLASTDHVASVGMPVNRCASLGMREQFQDRRLVLPNIPPLNGPVVSAKSKAPLTGRRPFGVTNAIAAPRERVFAFAFNNTAGAAEVPQTHGTVLTAGQQELAFMWVEVDLVDLPVVLI